MTPGHVNRSADVGRTLSGSHRVTVLTGAGVSAESGIPTFRDALTGLWSTFDAASLATAEAFRRDPALVWGWYEWRRSRCMRARPNAAHRAIAAMERRVPELTLVTQNVDDLHERAGSTDPIHLHGSLHEPRCFACARPYASSGEVPDEPEGGRRLEPPRCLHCGGKVRPGVVWFGETLPGEAWKRAESAARSCDLILVVGTSGLVEPAASLPRLAVAHGARVVRIDPRPEPADDGIGTTIAERAGIALPALVEAAWPAGRGT